MTTLDSGIPASIFSPTGGEITITPPVGGNVKVSGRSTGGIGYGQTISGAPVSFVVDAGTMLTLLASGGAGDYAAPTFRGNGAETIGGAVALGPVSAIGAARFTERTRRLTKIWKLNAETDAANTTFGATAGSNLTFVDHIELESRATRVRLVFANADTTATFTIGGARVSTSANITDDTNNTGAAASLQILFSGAATVTIPVAPGVRVKSYVVSDWIDLIDLDRTDGVERTNLYVRTLINTPVGTELVSCWARTGSVWTAYPRVFKSGFSTGSLLTSGAFAGTMISSGTLVTYAYTPLFGVQYDSRKKGFTAMVTGDSTSEGYFGPADADRGRGWAAKAQLLVSTPEQPVEFIGGGFGGGIPSEWGAAVEAMFTLGLIPQVLFIYCLSQNSISSGTISNTAAASTRAWIARLCELVESKGGIPIPFTGLPSSSYNAAGDLIRKALNFQLINQYGVLTLDAAALFGNTAAPQRFTTQQSQDGIHLVAAADDQLAAAAANLLTRAIPVYFA